MRRRWNQTRANCLLAARKTVSAYRRRRQQRGRRRAHASSTLSARRLTELPAGLDGNGAGASRPARPSCQVTHRLTATRRSGGRTRRRSGGQARQRTSLTLSSVPMSATATVTVSRPPPSSPSSHPRAFARPHRNRLQPLPPPAGNTLHGRCAWPPRPPSACSASTASSRASPREDAAVWPLGRALDDGICIVLVV